jgi:hypothetical protein
LALAGIGFLKNPIPKKIVEKESPTLSPEVELQTNYFSPRSHK